MGASDPRLRCATALTCVLLASACGGDDDGYDGPVLNAINECTPGRWLSHGGTASNQRHGCEETALTPETVVDLEEKWRITPGSVVGTPAVYDGVVYFASMDRQVHAVNADTGVTVWETPIDGGVQSSVLVTENSVYVADIGPSNRFAVMDPPSVYRLDRVSGELLEQVPFDEHPLSVGWSSAVYIEGANQIVIGVPSFEVFSPLPNRSFHGNVLSLNADTLEEEWRFFVNPEQYGPGVSVWSSPAVDTELKLVYIGTGQGYEAPVTPMSDALVAINYETGELAWSEQYTADDVYVLNGPDNVVDYDVGAPPTLFNLSNGAPAIGVGDKEGTFYAHDRRNGDLLWKTKITPGSALGGVMQSAAFEDGELFVISNKTAGGSPSLFALNADSGSEVWNVDLGEIAVFGAVTVVNGVIYFGDMNGRVHVRSAADGSVIWDDPHVRASTAAQRDAEAIAAGISVVNGTIYVPFGGQAFPTSYFTSADPAVLGGGVVAYHVP